MSAKLRGLCFALFALTLTVTDAVHAQLPPQTGGQTSKERAQSHFQLGIELFDQGNFRGAIGEFERAYALARYPIILFNIGLSYEALGEPVEAIEAMRKVLAEPRRLKLHRLDRARRTIREQAARIAQLTIRCNISGASVKVGGTEIGRTPLSGSVPVPSGKMLNVEASAKGYLPKSLAVLAPAGQQVPVVIDLTPADKPPAQVKVHTTLPGAQLWVDGKLVGVTPLQSTVGLEPDTPHRLELRREGYLPATETLTLGPGQQSEATLMPVENRAAIDAAGGKLQLILVQPDATVLIDGQRRSFGRAAIALAAGPHEVRLERSGHVPLTRTVHVRPALTTTISLDLPPTEQTRAEWIADAELWERIGWGVGITGVVLTAVGVPLLIGSASEWQSAGDERERHDDTCLWQNDSDQNGFPCQTRYEELDTAENRWRYAMIGSSVGLGLGLAATVTGIVILATGDDPESFRLQLGDEFASVTITPRFDLRPGRAAVGLGARF